MSDLQRLAELVRRESGIDVERLGLRALEAAVARVAPAMDATGVLAATADPATGASLRALLIEAVAVHETFFFRQSHDLTAIDWQDLHALARSAASGHVRVWVAACATGEEAYTVAMLACQSFGTTEPPVSIIASDISAAALLRAEHGRYGPRAVRNVPDALRTRYFTREDDQLVVGEELRRLVAFRRHNLVADPAPGPGFELILCRNALIYFAAPTVVEVVASLEKALTPGGELILSAADRLCGPPPARRRTRSQADAVPARTTRSRPRPQTARPAWRDVPPKRPVAALKAPVDGELDARLDAAVCAADAGRLDEAIASTTVVLEADPLNVDAHFVLGVAELAAGHAAAAAESLRRALYVDPTFSLAAFKLGRAYDELRDEPAARRAYAQALRTLDPADERHERFAAQIDAASIAAACRARLTGS